MLWGDDTPGGESRRGETGEETMGPGAVSTKSVGRRLFLRGLMAGVAGSVLMACAPAAQPTPTQPSTKPAEQPKPAQPTQPQPTPTPAAAAPKAAEKVTVRWQFRGTDAELKRAEEAVKALFTPKYPNINVVIEPAPDQRDEKLIAAMVAGTAPDVFESWTDNVTQFADRGQVLDVEPLVKRDFKPEDLKDFYQWQWKDFVLPSGIRFGLPKYVNVMVLWVNKDMFDQAGLKLPTLDWTHDDLQEAAVKLTKRSGQKTDVWGIYIPMWSWDRYWYRVEMWGGNPVNPNDPTECLLGEEKALAALEWARRLEWDLQAMAQPLAVERQGGLALFSSGRVAMAEDGFYPFRMAQMIQKRFKWQYAHTAKGPVTRRVLGTTDGFVIWKNTKVQEAAWTLLKFQSGPEYQEAQVKSTGLLPVRFSVLDRWKKIVTEAWPELAEANLDVGPQAMEMGYPGNRKLFKKDAEARQIIVPALEKLYIVGGTPVTYMKEIADQVTRKMRS
jgi:multiple sugar transport system substrate-binding protein